MLREGNAVQKLRDSVVKNSIKKSLSYTRVENGRVQISYKNGDHFFGNKKDYQFDGFGVYNYA